MKKIFMQFGSGLGPMSRSLPIALSLSEAGYRIKYIGYPSAKPFMQAAGIEELNQDVIYKCKQILPFAKIFHKYMD